MFASLLERQKPHQQRRRNARRKKSGRMSEERHSYGETVHGCLRASAAVRRVIEPLHLFLREGK